MDISLTELKEKEIINVLDGRKLGRIIDILFDIENGVVRGIVVPGERKLFKKGEDIFIPLEKLRKIGDDVVLVKIPIQNEREFYPKKSRSFENKKHSYYRDEKYYNRYNFQENNSGDWLKFNQKREYNPQNNFKSQSQSNKASYVRFKPINNKKYK